MSPMPLTPGPRLLLFPQVARPEAREGRPAVRRYSLSLIPSGRRVDLAPCPTTNPRLPAA